jgi:hypothetical protein
MLSLIYIDFKSSNFKVPQTIKLVRFVTLDNIKYVKPRAINFLTWMKKNYVIFTPCVLKLVIAYTSTIGNNDLKNSFHGYNYFVIPVI